MKLLKRWVNEYPFRMVAAAVILTVLFLVIQITANKCLRTYKAGRGISSLQYTYRSTRAHQIFQEWQHAECTDNDVLVAAPTEDSDVVAHPLIPVAIRNVYLDFPLIASYCFMLVVLVLLMDSVPGPGISGRTAFYIIAIGLAGLLDIVENSFLLYFLEGHEISPLTFALPATAKAVVLVTVVLYVMSKFVQAGSAYLQRFSTLLWMNRVSVIGLLVIYVALWKADQGQDLLLNLNASDIGPMFFYVVITVIAALNWFLPKYYTQRFMDSIPASSGARILLLNPSALSVGEEVNVPRILGVMTFVVPACGTLNALDKMSLMYVIDWLSPSWLMLVSLLITIIVVHYHLIEKLFSTLNRNGKGWVMLWILILLFITILFFGLINKNAPWQLANLSLGLYLLAIIFLIITSLRQDPAFYSATGFRPVMRWLKHQQASLWVMYAGILNVAIFAIVNVWPVVYASFTFARFLTLPVVFTGVAFYTMFFFVLLILGKYSRINWAGLVLLIAIIMAIVVDNRFHDIHRVERSKSAQMEDLDQYFKHWVDTRADEIRSEKGQYPVFIINTYGGGIRAAAWTSLVVSHLDSLSGGKFQRHVFAYSGASGGTIGASVMCALRKARNGNGVNPHEVVNFYQNDFLTPVLVGLIGRDVLFSTTGLDAVDDRARLQDHTWEMHLSPLDHGIYGNEFSSLWYDTIGKAYDVPLLFANTYHVESGLKAIMAPVRYKASCFPQSINVQQLLGESTVPFSTGAFLSARFPYISPAGKLDDNHHFLDGGLKENSGAETALELYTYIDRLINAKQEQQTSSDSLYRKLQVHFISLNNMGVNEPSLNTKNLVELTAPFTALYNNWVGNTLKADQVLYSRDTVNYTQLRPLQKKIKTRDLEFSPVLPLGWQISDFALRRLQESLSYRDTVAVSVDTPDKIEKLIRLIR